MKRTLLFAALLTLPGCSLRGLQTPMVPGVETPKVEFRAVLYGYGENPRPVEVSTVEGRFRLEDGDRVFIGDLDPKGEILVLGPKTKTYFRSAHGKFSELFETHDRPAATRYEGAVNASGVALREQILGSFKSPCQAAAQHRTHQECQHSPIAENLQAWSHTFHGRRSAQEGFKATEVTLRHQYDTKLGLIVGGDNTAYFKDPQVVELSSDRFQVPKDYQQLLSDEELRDPRFGYLGSSSMVSGTSWEGFMEFVLDSPPPPDRAQWTYQKEKWWTPKGGQDLIYLERIYVHGPFNPEQLPLNMHPSFNIKAWDAKAELGSHSFREGPKSLVFAVDNQLFRVQVIDNARADDVLIIAKALLPRARKDRAALKL